MATETIRMNGADVEADPDDVLEAVERLDDETYVRGDYAVVGTATVVGDGYADDDVRAIATEDVVSVDDGALEAADDANYAYTSLDNVRQAAQDATSSPFAEYIGQNYRVETRDDTAYGDSDVEVYMESRLTGQDISDTVGQTQMRDLIDDDGIEVTYVTTTAEDGVVVGVYDDRDE